jgi:hypothetical protein
MAIWGWEEHGVVLPPRLCMDNEKDQRRDIAVPRDTNLNESDG